MPLQKQVISINFATGLDTKTDGKLTTKLTTADNCVLRKTGTIEKRLGFVAFGSWNIADTPYKIFPFNDSVIVAASNSNSYTPLGVASNGSISGLGLILPLVGNSFTSFSGGSQAYTQCTLKTYPYQNDISSLTVADCCVIGSSATQNGTLIVAYNSATDSRVAVIDTDTQSRRKFINTNIGPPGSNPTAIRVVSVTPGSLTAYILANKQSSITITIDSMLASSNTCASMSSFSGAGNSSVTPQLDAVVIGSKIYFAANGSGTNIFIGSFDTNTAATSVTTIPASITPSFIAIATSATGTDRIHLVWSNGNSSTASYASYSLTLSQIQSATTFTANTLPIAGTSINLSAVEDSGTTFIRTFCTIISSTGLPSFVAFENVSSSGVSSLGRTASKGCQLIAKPFLANTVPTVIMANTQTAQQSLVVSSEFPVDYSAIGRCHYGIAAPISTTGMNLPSVPSNGFGTRFTVARRANYFSAQSGSITVSYGGEVVEINLSNTQPIPYVSLPSLSYFGGGFLGRFDVVNDEHGFLSSPSIVTVSTTTSGGSMTIGTYSAVILKEEIDGAGSYNASQPSQPYTFTISATTGSATVSLMDSIFSYKGFNSRYRYVVYRTASNGSIYYRDQTSGDISFLMRSITAFTFSLTISDAALAGSSILYTQGGVLPRWTPDSCKVLFFHNSRLFCDDPTDETILRFSSEFAPGEGATFSYLNQIKFPGRGRITAGASLDSNGIVFRQRMIMLFNGNGPDQTGTNGTFSDGQILFHDVGCINQRNLCRFRDGIIFKSPDKGFYLLARDLQLHYIGADVETYNSKTVVSSEVVGLAEADGTAEECRFLCSDGTLLTYNYYNGQWTTAALDGCTDAVYSGGKYVVINPSTTAANARVFQQSLSTYTDDFRSPASVTYQMTVETAWIKTGDIQGFQRVYKAGVLGEAQGPGKFTVEVGYDYESAYAETHTATMSSLTAANYTGGQTSAPQTDFTPTRQKCQAIRFRIKDIPDPGGGAVVKITNLSLECGLKVGKFLLPASKGI